MRAYALNLLLCKYISFSLTFFRNFFLAFAPETLHKNHFPNLFFLIYAFFYRFERQFWGDITTMSDEALPKAII